MPRWTKDEYGQKLREGRVTVSTPVIQAGDPVQDPNAELPVQAEPLAKNETPASLPGRVHVRVTSRRKRLADAEGICGKYVVDALRYAKIIRDDTVNDITYEPLQEKGEAYETVIEIFDRNPRGHQPANQDDVCPTCGKPA